MEKTVKDKVQISAFKAWKEAGMRGTIAAITGIGKNKIALMAASELASTAKVLFLAETTIREEDLQDEIKKWNYNGPPIQFMCYQSAYKLKGEHYDLVISDEVHNSLSPMYSAFFFNNTYDRIIGLSATIDPKALVNEDGSLTKEELLNQFAPVCFEYTIDDGQKDGTARKLNIYKVWHELDKFDNKAVTIGTKAKPEVTNEYAAYIKLDNKFKQAMFAPFHVKNFIIRNASAKRAELLYKLPSKVKAVKQLTETIKSKSILFGNDLESLLSITKNVVCSKNTAEENKKMREKFEKDKINLIASFKQLKQGANLSGLDNCIIMSYYSKELDLIQRVGRLRKKNDEYGNVFVFVTRNTVEEKWFAKMLENITSFEITEFNNIEECMDFVKLKKI